MTRAAPELAGATRPGAGIVSTFSIALFFLMAYGFTWLAVAPTLLARAGVIRAELPVGLTQIVGALAGPALAAVLITCATDGRRGVDQLLRRPVRWRVSIVWYVVTIFGPFFALPLKARLLFGTSFLGAFIRSLALVPTLYLPVLIAGVILRPPWEEIGWRGVALPRLQERLGPLVGTVVLAVLWATWHLPGYLGGWLGAFSATSFLALIIGRIGFSILMTWVYNHVDGSL